MRKTRYIVASRKKKLKMKNFPSQRFAKLLGYNSHVFGQKSYNGVAFLSKSKLENIKKDL